MRSQQEDKGPEAQEKQQGQSPQAPEQEEQTFVALETNSDQFSLFPWGQLEWASLLLGPRQCSGVQEGKGFSQPRSLCSAGPLVCPSTSLRLHVWL